MSKSSVLGSFIFHFHARPQYWLGSIAEINKSHTTKLHWNLFHEKVVNKSYCIFERHQPIRNFIEQHLYLPYSKCRSRWWPHHIQIVLDWSHVFHPTTVSQTQQIFHSKSWWISRLNRILSVNLASLTRYSLEDPFSVVLPTVLNLIFIKYSTFLTQWIKGNDSLLANLKEYSGSILSRRTLVLVKQSSKFWGATLWSLRKDSDINLAGP